MRTTVGSSRHNRGRLHTDRQDSAAPQLAGVETHIDSCNFTNAALGRGPLSAGSALAPRAEARDHSRGVPPLVRGRDRGSSTATAPAGQESVASAGPRSWELLNDSTRAPWIPRHATDARHRLSGALRAKRRPYWGCPSWFDRESAGNLGSPSTRAARRPTRPRIHPPMATTAAHILLYRRWRPCCEARRSCWRVAHFQEL